jgi:hypothetical protein
MRRRNLGFRLLPFFPIFLTTDFCIRLRRTILNAVSACCAHGSPRKYSCAAAQRTRKASHDPISPWRRAQFRRERQRPIRCQWAGPVAFTKGPHQVWQKKGAQTVWRFCRRARRSSGRRFPTATQRLFCRFIRYNHFETRLHPRPDSSMQETSTNQTMIWTCKSNQHQVVPRCVRLQLLHTACEDSPNIPSPAKRKRQNLERMEARKRLREQSKMIASGAPLAPVERRDVEPQGIRGRRPDPRKKNTTQARRERKEKARIKKAVDQGDRMDIE